MQRFGSGRKRDQQIDGGSWRSLSGGSRGRSNGYGEPSRQCFRPTLAGRTFLPCSTDWYRDDGGAGKATGRYRRNVRTQNAQPRTSPSHRNLSWNYVSAFGTPRRGSGIPRSECPTDSQQGRGGQAALEPGRQRDEGTRACDKGDP